MGSLRIGIIGLDTSHVTAFTELLHDVNHPYHVEGGRVVAAYPGGSSDFGPSATRVDGFTKALRDQYGVHIVEHISELGPRCDAFLLESVDGRVHLEQFQAVASLGKPVFVDKPFALTTSDAMRMITLAKTHAIPLMSCSALRYSDALTKALQDDSGGAILGCDAFGPMALEPTQPGLFWYGIHAVEVLFAVMGRDCGRVAAVSNADFDEVVGVWADGRIGTVRGNRRGNSRFGALLHREREVQYVDLSAPGKPYYASLLEEIIQMFRTGESKLDLEETAQIVRFIECANESRETGEAVNLH